jgi:hypothetical protein
MFGFIYALQLDNPSTTYYRDGSSVQDTKGRFETTEKVPTIPNHLFFWGTEMYNEAKKDRYKPFKWLNGLWFVCEILEY